MKTVLRGTVSAIVLTICVSFLSVPALAKLPANSATTVHNVVTGDWVLQSELNGVKAYYMISTCDSVPVVFLKFVNSNGYSVKVTWDDQVKVAGEANTRRTKTFSLSVTVNPGEIAGSTCTNPAVKELVSKTYLPVSAVLESFTFLNLAVTQN